MAGRPRLLCVAVALRQPRRRHGRAWRVARFVVGIALAGVAFWALNGQKGELVGASAVLSRLHPLWTLAAVGSEVASLVCFAALQRRLLSRGEVDVGLGYATQLTFAAGAISDSLPAGPAFASVYSFRQYRRHGADDAVAGWTLLATLVCSALGLALLATAGVLLATRESTTYDLLGVVLGVLVLAVVADAVVWQRHWLVRVTVFGFELARRVFHLPGRRGFDVVEDLVARLTLVRLTWRDLAATLLAAVGNWALDCGALAFGFLAVGAGVPWRGLLLAYGAGQLAANLPVTPGGLGLVEGSLSIALVAFGGGETTTVAAVLLYRIVSFWGYLPLGWAAWAGLAVRDRRADRRSVALHPAGRVAEAPGGPGGGARPGGTPPSPASGGENRSAPTSPGMSRTRGAALPGGPR